MGCTHKYPVVRSYRTPLLTCPHSTSSHVFVCRETKYFLGRHSVGETCLWCLTLVSEPQQAHCSTAFLSSSKALAHDSAATNLEMYHWIDTEFRKPQMGTHCQRIQRMKGRILTPCCKCIARNYPSELAHL